VQTVINPYPVMVAPKLKEVGCQGSIEAAGPAMVRSVDVMPGKVEKGPRQSPFCADPSMPCGK
jgi:hypothetical protein